MYAVMTTGGKQYRVEAGSELTIERLAADAGSPITFDRVLMVGDGDTITVGTPTVAGATVSGTVLGESLGPKLFIFKFKQKVKYRRMAGHRQHFTRVRIDEISASGKTVKAEKAETPAKADTAEKAAPARRTRSTGTTAAAKPETAEAPAATEKPKRTRKPAAAKAATVDAVTEKPKRARTAAAPKAEPQE